MNDTVLRIFSVLSLASFACVACGGVAEEHTNDAPAGGSAGTAGSGGSGDGGGEVIPPARGCVVALLGGGYCFGGDGVALIGGPPNVMTRDPGPRAVDGRPGTQITCRVSGTENFDVAINAQQDSTSFVLTDGKLNADGAGSGRISVVVYGTGPLASRDDMPCELQITTQPNYHVDSGRIWAGFDCPRVYYADEPDPRCHMNGYFLFENCEQ
jgi:hypothetical protein